MEKYTINTSKGPINVEFDDEPISFRIEGPKEIISKVVAGLGDEDDKRAWVTEKHLKTEAMRMYALLEIIKCAQADLLENDSWKTLHA